MLKIFAFPAGKGDFFVLKCEEKEKENYILIDGGDETGVRVYYAILKQLLDNKKTIDALIFTHIDDDHICGALMALMAMKELPEIKKIYINTGRGIEKRLKIRINNQFPEDLARKYLQKPKIEHTVSKALNLLQFFDNRGLTDKVESCICQGDKLKIGPMVLKVISPGRERLEKYVRFWNKEERKYDDIVLETHSVKQNQKKKKLSEYVKEQVMEDNSVTNGSSIAFILEYGNSKAAFLGDAWPSECIQGIRNWYPVGVAVDLIKIPHHGSARNFSNVLYELLRTNCVLLSTDGACGHPSPIFLGKLLQQIPDIKIFCNQNWIDTYGWEETDKERYCSGMESVFCVLKENVFLTESVLIGRKFSEI